MSAVCLAELIYIDAVRFAMGAILRRGAKMSELRNTMPPAALSRLVMGPIRSRPEGTSRPKGQRAEL